jgi:hypothetical protein
MYRGLWVNTQLQNILTYVSSSVSPGHLWSASKTPPALQPLPHITTEGKHTSRSNQPCDQRKKEFRGSEEKWGWLIPERIGPEETSHWPKFVHP